MAAIDPNILGMIDTGDLVMYRDATGKSYTLGEIIRSKQAGTFKSMKPGLTKNIVTLPNVPGTLTLPNLVNRSVNNKELSESLTNFQIPYTTNDKAPHMPKIISPDDSDAMTKDYPLIMEDADIWETLLADTPPSEIAETLVRLIPTGLLDAKGPLSRPLSFNQAPRNVGANRALYSVTIQITALMLEADTTNPLIPRMEKLLNEVHSMASSHFFGTGSILGQLGRIKKGFQIKRQSNIGRRATRLWNTVMERGTFFAIQDKARKIIPIPTTDPLDIDPLAFIKDPMIKIADTVTGDEVPLNLIHITKTADAGFPWESNANKGDSIIADIFLLKAMHEEARQSCNKAGANTFRDRWAWTAYHKLKAKAEIYDFANFHQKIRNISVPSNCIMLLPQMMFKTIKWATSTLQRPLATDTENSSLMGYAPFHGGHEKLITRAIDSVRLVLHYADNLFIFQEGRFASMDASSMEAIHTEASIKLCIEYMLTRGFGSVFKDGELVSGGAIGDTNAWLIHQWFGSIAANSPGVLRSFVIDVPGLASGMPGTFEFNDMLMSILSQAIKQLPPETNLLNRSGQPTQAVLDLANQLGFVMKTETVFPGPITSRSPSLYDAQSDPWTPYTEDATICKTDMLGFDTVYVKIGLNDPKAIAILARERLVKALTFNKSELRVNPLGPTTHTIIQLATINILYLSGGWAHPEIAIAIEATAKSLMAELSIGASATEVNNTNAAAQITSIALARAAQTIASEDLLDSSMAQGILRSMLATGLIPLTKVFEITHSRELAEDLLKFTKDHPTLTGPKLMRFIGPIEIASRVDQLEKIHAPWVQPTIDATLRALELLKPISESAKEMGTPTTELQKDERGVPCASEPRKPPMTKSKRPHSAGTLPLINALTAAEQSLGPAPSPVILVDYIIDSIQEAWDKEHAPLELRPDPEFADSVYGSAAALARMLRVPASVVLDRIDDIGRLISRGVIRESNGDEPGPSKRRRKH